MNLNLWNIKDMFSIPPGTGNSRSSSRSVPSDYSTLTDSQFLFGSQNCQDVSQPTSLETSVQTRQLKTSQQNSSDSDPSVFLRYQSKPYLFCGDGKDKGPLHFGATKSKGILDQFEEDRKKAKDKHDSEKLCNFLYHIQESIQGLQTSVSRFEELASSREKSTVDQYEHIAKALQENADHYASILNALKSKTMTEQTLLNIEQKLLNKHTEVVDLKSSLQLLEECVEVLKTEQCDQYKKLSEQLKRMPDQQQYSTILTELQKLSSTPRTPTHLKDSTSQTSPTLIQDLCLISQEKTYMKTTKVCQRSSLQAQPCVAVSPPKYGGCGESHDPKPVAFKDNVKTSDLMVYKPSVVSVNDKESMMKSASSFNLEAQLSCNPPYSGSKFDGQCLENVSEVKHLLAQEKRQITRAEKVPSQTDEKKSVNTVQQRTFGLRPRPHQKHRAQTGNTDQCIPPKTAIPNTDVEKTVKTGKPKREKSKMVLRKSKAGYSKRKKKAINVKASTDKVQKQPTCEEVSANWEDCTGNEFGKNSSLGDSGVYLLDPSAFPGSEDAASRSQQKEASAAPPSSSHQLAGLPKCRVEQTPKNTLCNSSRKSRKLLQLDYSSQDSSFFYCNIKSESQVGWFSPSSPHSSVTKTDSKPAFQSLFFDSSEDSG
ncbi:interactor of HORMAD1 protein 1 [Lissotriton helveticus]